MLSPALQRPQAAAAPPSRDHLERASRLLRSRDHGAARQAYAAALQKSQPAAATGGFFDVSACFLCHVRLAQLSLHVGAGGGITTSHEEGNCNQERRRAVARDHLEAAWALRDCLPRPLVGALAFYFSVVGLKLADLYGRGSGEALAVMACLEELGLISANDSAEIASEPSTAAATSAAAAAAALPGSASEVGTSLECDACGRATKGGAPAAVAPGEGAAWHCVDCTEAYDRAVAQVKVKKTSARQFCHHTHST